MGASIMSYMSMRVDSSPRSLRLERIADGLFITGLLIIFAAIALITMTQTLGLH